MNLRNAINRVSFGIKPDDLKQAESIGWESWVKQQLKLVDDKDCDQRISQIQYDVEYEQNGKERKKSFSLCRYFLSTEEIWKTVSSYDEPPEYLINMPAMETMLVTYTKAIHSKNQLFEIMVEFWHNHFNVSVEAEDQIALLLSVYDREVIRKHAFGNFRQFLEAVATSPCMLYYLDNAFSKASPANENYARELFELHTLGAMHYMNDLYDDWKHVPGVESGLAEGYIDEDVYEAARAFTGWTVADGHEEEGVQFPSTGGFHYYDQWHDHYQKRILGVEFKSHQDAMDDGRKVLDILAKHPGTAKYVCTKLCTWLVSDNPSESVINKAIDTWTKHLDSDDQIARTIETILLSSEFEQGLNTKVKRPNHLIASAIRQLDLPIQPNEDWFWFIRSMGYKQFSWPTPTGHPDEASYWLNTDMLLKRWNNVLNALFYTFEQNEEEPILTERVKSISSLTPSALFDYWSELLIGGKHNEEAKELILAKLREDLEGLKDNQWQYLLDEHPDAFEYKQMQLIALIAIGPEFHKR